MDAPLDSATTLPNNSTPKATDPPELPVILASISREISRSLSSLQSGIDQLLMNDARPVSAAQQAHLQTMATLCEDLLRLTHDSLNSGTAHEKPGV